jgi:hypothetical protein
LTNELVGIDVPKHTLEAGNVFTVNRLLLHTDDIPATERFPLLMTDADLKIYFRAIQIQREMRGAVEYTKNKDQADRDFVVGGTWADLMEKENAKK